MNVLNVLFLFLSLIGPGWFVCIVFESLVVVEVFVGSCYFVPLVVLMFILVVSSLVLVGWIAFWWCEVCLQQPCVLCGGLKEN